MAVRLAQSANIGLGRPHARRSRRASVNSTEQSERKASQRQRLLHAMIEVAGERGYSGASIARVIARAGVSRPTLYDYFDGRDACFLAALEEARKQLLCQVGGTVAGRPPQDAVATAVQSLVVFAEREPSMARVLFAEALSAGPRALDARDQTVIAIEQMIEDAYSELDAATDLSDMPARIVVGAIWRLLGCHLRRPDPGLQSLQQELSRWVASYARPAGEHRWRRLSAAADPEARPSGAGAEGVLRTAMHARGSPNGASAGHELEERRRRVLLALAELSAEKGYRAVTIAEISGCAGVEIRAFYRLYAGKREAFAALGELYFRHMMALTAGAFFSARAWPERVLAAKLAIAGCVEQNPALARACFIEGYAADGRAARRVEQLTRAFTLFLSDGHEHAKSAPRPRVVLEAIAHANFELIYHQARASAMPQMAHVLGHSLHLCLAPFIGPAAAAELIDDGCSRAARAVSRPRA
jgi:AcrR family transcriptional regulator